MIRTLLVLSLLLTTSCQASDGAEKRETTTDATTKPVDKSKLPADVDVAPAGKGIATFAGGCFWCVEKPFESVDGVEAVYSGYAGGPEEHPTYRQVASGTTGHTEAVRVIYDPAKVKYELLLAIFWRNINPTQVNGQFVDHGTQYRTAIFYHDDAQKALAEASLKEVQAKFDDPIAVQIVPEGPFWPAEEYHQDFYKKSPDHYKRYRQGSGRDTYLEKTWGKEAGGYSLHSGAH